jgi:mono/diheme cytochrome c family protein
VEEMNAIFLKISAALPVRVTLALFAVLFCAQAAAEKKPEVATHPPNRYVLEELPASYRPLLDDGQKIYQTRCAMCHGNQGGGDGPVAATLAVKPRIFTDSHWMAGQADGGFLVAALYGIPGSTMPAFAGQLSEKELWAAVAYIRQFSPRKVLHNTTQYWPVYAEAGAQLYQQHCAGCHGEKGAGDGPAAQFFTAAPRDLTNTDWMASYSDPQLKAIIRLGVSGSPMPGFDNELTDREITSLIKHLRHISNTQFNPNPITGPAEQLYLNHCAACHGVNGNGDGPTASQLSPSPRTFRNARWMAAQSDEQLSSVIIDGRKGTAMPPFGALLSAQQTDSLVRYLRGFTQSIPGHQASGRGYD